MTQNTWVRRPLEVGFGLLIAFAVIGVVLVAARWLFADVTPFDGHMMDLGMSAFMVVLWVIFALVVAALVMWAVFTFAAPAFVHQFGKGPSDWSSFAAVSELKKRYAKGEMTREDFLQRLEDLERGAPVPSSPVSQPK